MNDTTFNLTIPINKNAWQSNPEYYDWCVQQHFAFQNNLRVEGLGIIFIAMLSTFVALVILLNSDYFMKQFPEKKVILVYKIFSIAPLFLLIGFFVWSFIKYGL